MTDSGRGSLRRWTGAAAACLSVLIVTPLVLGAQEVRGRELELALRPVEIEGLRVTIDGRCRPSSEVTDAARRLWEDARAVLRTAGWAERQERYRFTLTARPRRDRYQRGADEEAIKGRSPLTIHRKRGC